MASILRSGRGQSAGRKFYSSRQAGGALLPFVAFP
jgi:hypothetical protein